MTKSPQPLWQFNFNLDCHNNILIFIRILFILYIRGNKKFPPLIKGGGKEGVILRLR